MKAVIMAGGEGTRLRPLTSGIPKPMVPVMNKPVMEHIINLLKKHQIMDIAVTMCYLPEVITDYFGNGDKFSVKLSYYIEDTPLGTGGSVLNAKEFLDDTFVVISGDAFTDIDISKALEYHKTKNSSVTLVLKKEPIPLEYGIVITDENGKITRFLEKPSWGEVFSDTINTGIYIINPEVLNYYKKGENFDFSKDLFPRLLKDNVPMYGYITNNYWCDIGDLISYKQTHFDILNKKVAILTETEAISSGIYAGKNTYISNKSILNPPVFIGNNCKISDNVVLDSYTIIGDDCEIGEGSTLKRSIIWNKNHLGKNIQCRGTTICSKNNIANNVNLFEDSVVGNECSISAGATIKPNIKIWPNKTIKEGTTINHNMVWGTKASKTLFGNNDISGDINTEITPEFASLIGSAFACVVSKNSPIILSSDASSSAKLIKQSISTGLISTGVQIIDINSVIMPIHRYAVRFYQASGGIHVSSDITETNKIHIEFTNNNGGNIDRKLEKKIESLYIREDFQRCNSDMIKDTINVNDFYNYYIQCITNSVNNINDIKLKNPKILVTSTSEYAINTASKFLDNLGCNVDVTYPVNKYKSLKEYVPSIVNLMKVKSIETGVIISDNCENIILIDENGEVIDNEKYLALVSLIAIKYGKCKKLIIPYTTTSKIEEIGNTYNTEIIRTKSDASTVMNELLSSIDTSKDFLIQYQLSFDGITAIGRIISFLVEYNTSLSNLVKEIPEFHMKKSEISCDFKDRGRIIRELIEQNKKKKVELFEGVKINTKHGWTLVLPDNERPVFNIYSEGYTEEYAEELSSDMIDNITHLIKDVDDNK